MSGQCCFRNSGNCCTVIPSIPALPLLALTRANACLQFSRSQTPSIHCSPMAGLSVPRFPASDSVPPSRPFGASPLYSASKANTSWFFCRLSLMSRAAYSPLPSTPCGGPFGLHRLRTMPSDDFCRRSESITRPSVPDKRQISRGKFDRFPRATAGFTTGSIDGYGFCNHLLARPTPYASDPALVHWLSDPSHDDALALRDDFTPSGCQREFHPRAVEHARYTKKRP